MHCQCLNILKMTTFRRLTSPSSGKMQMAETYTELVFETSVDNVQRKYPNCYTILGYRK